MGVISELNFILLEDNDMWLEFFKRIDKNNSMAKFTFHMLKFTVYIMNQQIFYYR